MTKHASSRVKSCESACAQMVNGVLTEVYVVSAIGKDVPLCRQSCGKDRVQQIADALFDLIELLNEAQSSGFPSARSQVIRHHLKSTTLDEIPRIRRIETRVRNWIHRHDM